MAKIYLTEEQIHTIVEKELMEEGLDKVSLERLKSLFRKGMISAAFFIASIGTFHSLSPEQKMELVSEVATNAPVDDWIMVADDVVATVYNAVASQCNSDVLHTASMFKLNLDDVASHKIIAMERTFMKDLGLSYGDVVKVEGTYQGKQDGIYQIQDTMNKRFAGQHKIDILVPNNIKYGGTLKNEPAKIYVLRDKERTAYFKADMAPSLKEMINYTN